MLSQEVSGLGCSNQDYDSRLSLGKNTTVNSIPWIQKITYNFFTSVKEFARELVHDFSQISTRSTATPLSDAHHLEQIKKQYSDKSDRLKKFLSRFSTLIEYDNFSEENMKTYTLFIYYYKQLIDKNGTTSSNLTQFKKKYLESKPLRENEIRENTDKQLSEAIAESTNGVAVSILNTHGSSIEAQDNNSNLDLNIYECETYANMVNYRINITNLVLQHTFNLCELCKSAKQLESQLATTQPLNLVDYLNHLAIFKDQFNALQPTIMNFLSQNKRELNDLESNIYKTIEELNCLELSDPQQLISRNNFKKNLAAFLSEQTKIQVNLCNTVVKTWVKLELLLDHGNKLAHCFEKLRSSENASGITFFVTTLSNTKDKLNLVKESLSSLYDLSRYMNSEIKENYLLVNPSGDQINFKAANERLNSILEDTKSSLFIRSFEIEESPSGIESSSREEEIMTRDDLQDKILKRRHFVVNYLGDILRDIDDLQKKAIILKDFIKQNLMNEDEKDGFVEIDHHEGNDSPINEDLTVTDTSSEIFSHEDTLFLGTIKIQTPVQPKTLSEQMNTLLEQINKEQLDFKSKLSERYNTTLNEWNFLCSRFDNMYSELDIQEITYFMTLLIELALKFQEIAHKASVVDDSILEGTKVEQILKLKEDYDYMYKEILTVVPCFKKNESIINGAIKYTSEKNGKIDTQNHIYFDEVERLEVIKKYKECNNETVKFFEDLSAKLSEFWSKILSNANVAAANELTKCLQQFQVTKLPWV